MSKQGSLTGIFEEGYGMIAKSVMRDKDLTIEAKAIYSYLVSFSGAGLSSFPSTSLILSELGISNKRYLTHRKKLEEKGYIVIERERTDNGFSKNRYYIISDLSVCSQNVQLRNVYVQNVHEQNDHTIINSINNNSINNNSINNKHMSDFEEFYKKYPRKVQKKKAEQKFNNVVKDKETFDKIMEDLEKRKYFEQWIKNDGKFIPHPTTYLNGELWNDEYQTISINENKKGVLNEFGSVEAKD